MTSSDDLPPADLTARLRTLAPELVPLPSAALAAFLADPVTAGASPEKSDLTPAAGDARTPARQVAGPAKRRRTVKSLALQWLSTVAKAGLTAKLAVGGAAVATAGGMVATGAVIVEHTSDPQPLPSATASPDPGNSTDDRSSAQPGGSATDDRSGTTVAVPSAQAVAGTTTAPAPSTADPGEDSSGSRAEPTSEHSTDPGEGGSAHSEPAESEHADPEPSESEHRRPTGRTTEAPEPKRSEQPDAEPTSSETTHSEAPSSGSDGGDSESSDSKSSDSDSSDSGSGSDG